MPGPQPNPNRRRRNHPPGTVELPAGGWQGPIPTWPLIPDPGVRARLEVIETNVQRARDMWGAAVNPRAVKACAAELERLTEAQARLEAYARCQDDDERGLWADLWRTPMAARWVELGWLRDVALYVRLQVRAEHGDGDAGKEARQWSDRLGLNPQALARLRWAIAEAPAVTADEGDDLASVTELYG